LALLKKKSITPIQVLLRRLQNPFEPIAYAYGRRWGHWFFAHFGDPLRGGFRIGDRIRQLPEPCKPAGERKTVSAKGDAVERISHAIEERLGIAVWDVACAVLDDDWFALSMTFVPSQENVFIPKVTGILGGSSRSASDILLVMRVKGMTLTPAALAMASISRESKPAVRPNHGLFSSVGRRRIVVTKLCWKSSRVSS
jgi:hypothetical protein